jgi:hypothetical protein
MPSKVIQIPLDGGSGPIPSGAIQFRNDWPGLFLRGDKSIMLASIIRGLQQRLSEHPDKTVGAALVLLGEVAEIIERDVAVRDADT